MRQYKKSFLLSLVAVTILLVGCFPTIKGAKDYEEIPPMLDILTNKVQLAIEEGYYDKGEQAVLAHVGMKNPDVLEWFAVRNYELRVGIIADYAVVLVCDEGRPIFEDTYCNPGFPDKDHRSNNNLKSCEISMTIEEVKKFCE
jgi:hypothetical protein